MHNEFITIESHFGLATLEGASENHSILARTRNRCAQDLVEMINEISSILYPEEEFEVYFLPSEPGGFRDILKIVRKYPKGAVIAGMTILCTVAGTTIGYLTYKDSHENHEHDKKMWIIEDVKKCIELEKEKANLDEEFDISNFPQDKIDAVCGSLELQEKKNSRYRTLKNDDNITEEETILKNDSNDILMIKKVDSINFDKYIAPIVKEEGFVSLETDGLIELLGPVVRQRKEGGGIKWKGIYHGNNVIYEDKIIFTDGEGVDFYMQDYEFKDKILSQDIVFKNGDNMAVKMTITFYLSDSKLNRRNVYVSEIMRFNEDVIEHKVKNKKENIVPKNQLSLLQ